MRWARVAVFARLALFDGCHRGHIAVWIDDKQVVDLHGVTADAEGAATGYPAKGSNHFFFKMGLYRDLMPQPMTVYIDEYSKREMKADEF